MDDALSALIRSANEVVSLFVAPGMVLALGLCFFFVAIPQCRALRGYTRSRSLMGVAFLLYGAALIAVIAGVIELCSWGYIQHQKKH